ncbi:MAG: hypothetical protein ACRD88_03160, partial [Terriglobia bacterium]
MSRILPDQLGGVIPVGAWRQAGFLTRSRAPEARKNLATGVSPWNGSFDPTSPGRGERKHRKQNGLSPLRGLFRSV